MPSGTVTDVAARAAPQESDNSSTSDFLVSPPYLCSPSNSGAMYLEPLSRSHYVCSNSGDFWYWYQMPGL